MSEHARAPVTAPGKPRLITGVFGELHLELGPGIEHVIQAPGLFAITDLKLWEWERGKDWEARLRIRSEDGSLTRTECSVRLAQVAKRGRFPLQLFFVKPTLRFDVESAEHPVLITVHYEAIAP